MIYTCIQKSDVTLNMVSVSKQKFVFLAKKEKDKDRYNNSSIGGCVLVMMMGACVVNNHA